MKPEIKRYKNKPLRELKIGDFFNYSDAENERTAIVLGEPSPNRYMDIMCVSDSDYGYTTKLVSSTYVTPLKLLKLVLR